MDPYYNRYAYGDDNDEMAFKYAMKEAKEEALCMFLGFVCLAIIPSILLLYIPEILQGDTTTTGNASPTGTAAATKTSESRDEDNDIYLLVDDDDVKVHGIITTSLNGATNPFTVIVTVLALLMWLLGIWKSHFLLLPQSSSSSSSTGGGDGNVGNSHQHNWFFYSLETVVILLVCISTAYGFGTMFLYMNFIPNFVVDTVVEER